MRLAVLRERKPGETRVAATPETVKKLAALGLTVVVETGAGAGASIPDADFAAAGAEIVATANAALAGAGVVFAGRVPSIDGVGQGIQQLQTQGSVVVSGQVVLTITVGACTGTPTLVAESPQVVWSYGCDGLVRRIVFP